MRRLLTRRLASTLAAPVYDVAIIGGGVVGTTLAALLAASSPALSVALVEARAPAPLPAAGAPLDLRTYALSPASVALLARAGAWPRVAAAGRAAPFSRMVVWEALGAARLEWGEAPADAAARGAPPPPPLGTMVEHALVAAALWERAEALAAAGALALRAGPRAGAGAGAPLGLAALSLPRAEDDAAAARALGGAGLDADDAAGRALASLTLTDGSALRARLVVGADGGASTVRALAGGGTCGWDYADQRALVATVALDAAAGRGGRGAAWQRFLPAGPLAVLPLAGDAAAVVWTTAPVHAAALRDMPPADFVAALNAALEAPAAAWAEPGGGGDADADAAPLFFSPLDALARGARAAAAALRGGGGAHGDAAAPPRALTALGARAVLPLRASLATALTSPRLALVGDAAHTMHPLAGQGLNLGLADARALAEVIARGAAAGEDAGSPRVLAAYARARAAPNAATTAGVDALKRLWAGTPEGALGAALGAAAPRAVWAAGGLAPALRDLGTALLSATPGVKAALARAAQGT